MICASTLDSAARAPAWSVALTMGAFMNVSHVPALVRKWMSVGVGTGGPYSTILPLHLTLQYWINYYRLAKRDLILHCHMIRALTLITVAEVRIPSSTPRLPNRIYVGLRRSSMRAPATRVRPRPKSRRRFLSLVQDCIDSRRSSWQLLAMCRDGLEVLY